MVKDGSYIFGMQSITLDMLNHYTIHLKLMWQLYSFFTFKKKKAQISNVKNENKDNILQL